jgi:thiamine biosynthesis lipoprotein
MIASPPARERRVRPDRTRPRFPAPAPDAPIVPVSHVTSSMGGRLSIHLGPDWRGASGSRGASGAGGPSGGGADAARVGRQVAGRIETWAARLTRHADSSELIALNDDPRSEVAVGPTLAAVLRAGRAAAEISEGLADITLLDARLAAEDPGATTPRPSERPLHREWSISPGPRGAATVRRPPGLRFDLGGVGKGWIADRAMDGLAAWPSAVVDADGDMAIRCSPGRSWEVGVDDPRAPDGLLAVLRLSASSSMPERWGVATSGTSVHRWNVGGELRHHIIDPRTGRPAVTDVVQATVVAGSALTAEALAKAVVIAGTVDGFALLERAGVLGAVVLTDRGETLALPNTLPLLAA